MSSVVFHPLPEAGHITPTLTLARALRDRGHRVIYLLEEEMRDTIEEHGFAFAPYLSEERPAAFNQAVQGVVGDDRQELLVQAGYDEWSKVVSHRQSEELAELSPSVLIGDVCRVFSTLVAHASKLPYIRCSTSLPAHRRGNVPPLCSHLAPNEVDQFDLDGHWAAAKGPNLSMLARPDVVIEERFTEFFTCADLSPAEYSEDSIFAHYMVRTDAELVLCSRAFDFPSSERPEQFYAGPCLENVQETGWSYPGRRATAPLVYCSFGSQASRYRDAPRFIAQLSQVAKRRPDIDLLIAGPPEFLAEVAPSSNVHTSTWLPQREVLQQASLFITHGGLGSVKEAIWAGVPLLVLPQSYDQPGNAARVEYHSLGKRFTSKSDLSIESIEDALADLLDRPIYREAMARMSKRFRSEASMAPAVDFVEAVIRGELPRAALRERYRATYAEAQMAIHGE